MEPHGWTRKGWGSVCVYVHVKKRLGFQPSSSPSKATITGEKKVVYYMCDCHRHSGSSSHILVCCILVNSFQRLCRFCKCLKKKFHSLPWSEEWNITGIFFWMYLKWMWFFRSALYIIHKQRIPSINKTFNLPSFGQPNQN